MWEVGESAKARLKRLTLIAMERYASGEPFTMEEVDAYFACVKAAFGEEEVSGFLNLVLNTIRMHGYKNLKSNFGMAVIVAIGERASGVEWE